MSELAQIVDESEEPSGEQPQELQTLGSRLKDNFQKFKDARKQTEDEWLKDLRQFQAIYEPDVWRDSKSLAQAKCLLVLPAPKSWRHILESSTSYSNMAMRTSQCKQLRYRSSIPSKQYR